MCTRSLGLLLYSIRSIMLVNNLFHQQIRRLTSLQGLIQETLSIKAWATIWAQNERPRYWTIWMGSRTLWVTSHARFWIGGGIDACRPLIGTKAFMLTFGIISEVHCNVRGHLRSLIPCRFWVFDHAFRLLVATVLFLLFSSCFPFLYMYRYCLCQDSHYLPFYRGRYLFKWCWSLGAGIHKDLQGLSCWHMWWWQWSVCFTCIH